MNKKHLKLYLLLFCVSCFLTANMLSVFANTTQEVTVQYEQPSIDELNTYEIEIPSTISIAYGETTKVVPIGISDDASLTDGYTVYVDIDKSCFTEDDVEDEVYDMLSGVKLTNTSDSNYYYVFMIRDENGSRLYTTPKSTADKTIAKFSNTDLDDVNMTFEYVPSLSTNADNLEGGTYTGKLIFNIYSQY